VKVWQSLVELCDDGKDPAAVWKRVTDNLFADEQMA
jgi:hypothetical protein